MVVHSQVSFAHLNRKKALLLSVFLGIFGIHRFYLREPWIGLSYLVFAWSLVPLLLSVIDFAFLARMSEDEFDEEYNEVPRIAA
jgi:TM2 domain-containing membrane protein YozV